MARALRLLATALVVLSVTPITASAQSFVYTVESPRLPVPGAPGDDRMTIHLINAATGHELSAFTIELTDSPPPNPAYLVRDASGTPTYILQRQPFQVPLRRVADDAQSTFPIVRGANWTAAAVYELVVFARSTVTGTFNNAQAVRVIVP